MAQISATELLRTLGAGTIPKSASAQSGATNAVGFDFASLLRRAESGELSSGRALRGRDGAEAVFTQDQLDRLAQAADAAEAAGASVLFASIDGQGAVIDLATRTIERVIDLVGADTDRVAPADVLVGVDAVAVVPDRAGDGAPLLGAAARPAGRVDDGAALRFVERIDNSSLLAQLGSVWGRHKPTR